MWGVDDKTHSLVGTTFNPLIAKAKGNQDLLIWLKLMLTPNANYEFDQFDHDGRHYVVLTVQAACDQPVSFKNAAYVREGSSTTSLTSGSAREVELWRRLQRSNFEERVSLEDVTKEEIAKLLDVESFFDLLGVVRPTSYEAAALPLKEQGIVREQDNGRLSITNLGALLLA